MNSLISHFYPQETSIKKTSYTCKFCDEMPKRDLDVASLYSGTIERNNKTEGFEDLFCDACETFENMHLGLVFLNDECDMDTKFLDSDWKEVFSWQAWSDTILSKIICDSWLNLESNKKTYQY